MSETQVGHDDFHSAQMHAWLINASQTENTCFMCDFFNELNIKILHLAIPELFDLLLDLIEHVEHLIVKVLDAAVANELNGNDARGARHSWSRVALKHLRKCKIW